MKVKIMITSERMHSTYIILGNAFQTIKLSNTVVEYRSRSALRPQAGQGTLKLMVSAHAH